MALAMVRAQGQPGGQNGVALVIGNSKYHWEAPLPNVKRDAPDIARAFQGLGLKTELVQGAGHGADWETDTHPVAVDADLSTPSTVKTLVNIAEVDPATKEAAHRLLVYDNCRNNPADGWRQLAAASQGQYDRRTRPHGTQPSPLS